MSLFSPSGSEAEAATGCATALVGSRPSRDVAAAKNRPARTAANRSGTRRPAPFAGRPGLGQCRRSPVSPSASAMLGLPVVQKIYPTNANNGPTAVIGLVDCAGETRPVKHFSPRTRTMLVCRQYHYNIHRSSNRWLADRGVLLAAQASRNECKPESWAGRHKRPWCEEDPQHLHLGYRAKRRGAQLFRAIAVTRRRHCLCINGRQALSCWQEPSPL